jgi:hypothetical protein
MLHEFPLPFQGTKSVKVVAQLEVILLKKLKNRHDRRQLIDQIQLLQNSKSYSVTIKVWASCNVATLRVE